MIIGKKSHIKNIWGIKGFTFLHCYKFLSITKCIIRISLSFSDDNQQFLRRGKDDRLLQNLIIGYLRKLL